MIIRITAKDAPRNTVRRLLSAARQHVGRQTPPPILTGEHRGSYYVQVDDQYVAKLFQDNLVMIGVHSEAVDELPGRLRAQRNAPALVMIVIDLGEADNPRR